MIGLIGAMDVEIEILKEKTSKIEIIKIANRVFYKGFINSKPVVIVCAGIGKVNASITTTLLLNNFPIKKVINIGIAGGIFPAKSLDLIISTNLVYNDVDTTIFGDKYGQIPNSKPFYSADDKLINEAEKACLKHDVSYLKGFISSGDKFVTKKDDLNKILSLYDCLASEMEGCAIAHTCYEFCIPFIVLRTISDVLGDENQKDNYEKAKEKAIDIVSKIVIDIL